ncbi:hypothetical protein BC936DRAFT_144567 [Jimgerdemannia flammicorona]|uniref:Uncharacterized protein n=1 Tax=Jimgerdemannia flammicorona TaxID=994334 RepID=A0A433DM30_9FUNG|nr:hypothetical protein BC936DRAFT_144567 [Jimgerdemannia flammicorona]
MKAYQINCSNIPSKHNLHTKGERVDAEGNYSATWKTVSLGTATRVWAVSVPELKGKSGAYLEDMSMSCPQTEHARDPNAAEKLWSVSEKVYVEGLQK